MKLGIIIVLLHSAIISKVKRYHCSCENRRQLSLPETIPDGNFDAYGCENICTIRIPLFIFITLPRSKIYELVSSLESY